MSQLTEDDFLKDVQHHEMHVLQDDGTYRHVRFKRPSTGCMHFDLITYPGYLVYSGDMGCYVFSRLEDMFSFFRTDRDYQRRYANKLCINLGYWSEKLRAVDGSRTSASAKEFSEDKFRRVVLKDLINWLRNKYHQTTKEERRDLWDAVIDTVINVDGDTGGHRQQIAAHDFSHFVNHEIGQFYFRDFWDNNLYEYTYRFVWCCYAIAWGIEEYDKAKAQELERAKTDLGTS